MFNFIYLMDTVFNGFHIFNGLQYFRVSDYIFIVNGHLRNITMALQRCGASSWHQDSRVAGQVRILDPVSLGEKHNVGVPVGATRTYCTHLYTTCFLSNSTAVSL